MTKFNGLMREGLNVLPLKVRRLKHATNLRT